MPFEISSTISADVVKLNGPLKISGRFTMLWEIVEPMNSIGPLKSSTLSTAPWF